MDDAFHVGYDSSFSLILDADVFFPTTVSSTWVRVRSVAALAILELLCGEKTVTCDNIDGIFQQALVKCMVVVVFAGENDGSV